MSLEELIQEAITKMYTDDPFLRKALDRTYSQEEFYKESVDRFVDIVSAKEMYETMPPEQEEHLKELSETCNQIIEDKIDEINYRFLTEEPFLRRAMSFGLGIDWSKVNSNSKGAVENKTVKENCDFCREDKSYKLDDTYGSRKICKKCQNLPEPNAPFSVDESFWC